MKQFSKGESRNAGVEDRLEGWAWEPKELVPLPLSPGFASGPKLEHGTLRWGGSDHYCSGEPPCALQGCCKTNINFTDTIICKRVH